MQSSYKFKNDFINITFILITFAKWSYKVWFFFFCLYTKRQIITLPDLTKCFHQTIVYVKKEFCWQLFVNLTMLWNCQINLLFKRWGQVLSNLHNLQTTVVCKSTELYKLYWLKLSENYLRKCDNTGPQELLDVYSK